MVGSSVVEEDEEEDRLLVWPGGCVEASVRLPDCSKTVSTEVIAIIDAVNHSSTKSSASPRSLQTFLKRVDFPLIAGIIC